MVNIKSPFKRHIGNLRVLKYLQRNGKERAFLIAERLSMNKQTVSGILRALIKEGQVERISRGVYNITEQGEQKLKDEDY